jgi:hypothetical protein
MVIMNYVAVGRRGTGKRKVCSSILRLPAVFSHVTTSLVAIGEVYGSFVNEAENAEVSSLFSGSKMLTSHFSPGFANRWRTLTSAGLGAVDAAPDLGT